MPVYAYACTACGNAFDKRQSFAEPALTVCETCGGALRKQYGTVGVTFNGTGFYRTDSRAAAQPASSGSSAAKTSSGPQPAVSTSAAASGGAGTVS
ncbi:FmdB family zinc ribbon protein [Agrococcus sp. ARC_14]|uniref:FmdB family zinc ribbon protein n=1 Tax=Agrococcus sp. ARC_14 TaxID=2919927 RepID=UPI001F051676|nr:FmdB family zinc ribbon protein [Agrococcus sp. ARC_14]MCH1884338.1 FmdB family transcriptional regulator [Agrococcus sp. ARC_14]